MAIVALRIMKLKGESKVSNCFMPGVLSRKVEETSNHNS